MRSPSENMGQFWVLSMDVSRDRSIDRLIDVRVSERSERRETTTRKNGKYTINTIHGLVLDLNLYSPLRRLVSPSLALCVQHSGERRLSLHAQPSSSLPIDLPTRSLGLGLLPWSRFSFVGSEVRVCARGVGGSRWSHSACHAVRRSSRGSSGGVPRQEDSVHVRGYPASVCFRYRWPSMPSSPGSSCATSIALQRYDAASDTEF